MQGYISFLLLITQVLTMSLSDVVIEDNERKSSTEFNQKYIENHRKLSIFPKNNIKFVLTPKPYAEKVYTHNPKQNIMKKISLMPQVTKRDTISTAAVITRKPLMKLRTFTIKSDANEKYSIIEKFKQNSTNTSKETGTLRTIGMIRNDPVTVLDEDLITEVYLPEESRVRVEKRILLNKTDNKVLDSQQNKQDKEGKNVMRITKADNFSTKKKEDRKEFIFLTSNKKVENDLLDNINQDFDLAHETTTDFRAIQINSRLKRSINIIEEENVPSTISGLKYTGRDTRLNHDNYFKNINS